jgi:Family of unknown function (DUF6188)
MGRVGQTTTMMNAQVPSILGRSLRSVCRDDETDQWIFDFGEGLCLQVAAPWRLTKSGSIALGHCDHRQKFGLPQPVDAERAFCDLVKDQVVLDAVIANGSADLSIDFGAGIRFEVFNNSSGYEGWQLNLPGGRVLVGQGGGNVVEWEG